MNGNRKANFFIVGFMKSGTTALADFLGQHPDICISIPKEPAFFATDLMEESDAFHNKKVYFKVRSQEDYKNIFKHAKKGQKLGEASTAYIYSKVAARKIRQYNPDAKIIIMIRNPIDFMHALHMQYLNETVEDEKDIEKAMALEDQRRRGQKIPPRARVPSYLFYSERLKYYKQVKRYFDAFPRDQILVILHDDFLKDNQKIYAEAAKFLGVSAGFKPNFGNVHGSKAPRFEALHTLIHYPPLKNALQKALGGHRYTKLHKKLAPILMKKTKRSAMPGSVKKQVTATSLPEIKKLSELLGQDLEKRWFDKTV